MKAKIFKIHLADETRDFEELKVNKFLESVFVRQSFASVVNDEYWSILVFYEETAAAFQSETAVAAPPPIHQIQTLPPEIPISPKTPPVKSAEAESPVSEPLVLTPAQENKFNALKQWRNERAAADGLPPYMIAPNDALMSIAAAEINAPEDLLAVKGFGEKRAQKYGEEILRVLHSAA
jgi:superfamily II DNA helicase RecQ